MMKDYRHIKPSTILVEAAKYVEQSRYYGGCAAIKIVGTRMGAMPYKIHEARKYFELFRPKGRKMNAFWFGIPAAVFGAYQKSTTPKQHEHRVMSLLMAAAIAKSEGN